MADMIRVVFHPMEKMVSAVPGSTVLAALRSAGIQVESICGGKGECSKCKVIHVHGDCDAGTPGAIRGLTEDEISQNYCRACQTHILGHCEFIIPVESRIDSPKILRNHQEEVTEYAPSVTKHLLVKGTPSSSAAGHPSLKLDDYTGRRPHMTRDQLHQLTVAREPVTVTLTRSDGYPEVMKIESGDTRSQNFGVALDLGTTTVVGVLIDLFSGKVCAEASALNCQITYGEELLTRIAVAKKPGGKEKLQAAAVESINAVIGQLIAAAGVEPGDIHDVCIAGNTVMTYLLLAHDPAILEMANADIPRTSMVVKAQALGIAVYPFARVFFLPNVSRFVGGDAVGDIITARHDCLK